MKRAPFRKRYRRKPPTDKLAPPLSQELHGKSAAPQRLQKILAAAGLGSRRSCEALIAAGRVEVDGQVASELGCCVDPRNQEIRVDGTALAKSRRVYFLVNKPTGIVSTNRDPSGRPRVIDLVPKGFGHVYTVGRLDLSSEGLILVTNDGELANRLTHPRYEVPKVYMVLVAGVPSDESLAKLQQGVHLAEGRAHVDRLRVVKSRRQSTQLEMVLREGRNREIRRLLAAVGHKVLRLKRVAMGPLRLADLPVGEVRRLEPREVKELIHASRQSHDRRTPDATTSTATSAAVAGPVEDARPRRWQSRPGKPHSGRQAAQRRSRRKLLIADGRSTSRPAAAPTDGGQDRTPSKLRVSRKTGVAAAHRPVPRPGGKPGANTGRSRRRTRPAKAHG